jgi:uncharacterized protein YecE (DUF72 family)
MVKGGGGRRGAIAVGTSGWSYDDWAGAFYPREVPRSRWFVHYAASFPTVEINYSFYRLPSETTVRRWREEAPRGFRFALKGSRYVTHMRRLQDEAPVRRFTERVAPLGAALGVILWQLPRMAVDVQRLAAFLESLPRDVRHAVEFRDPSWLTDQVFDLLRRQRVAHVSVSSTQMPRDLTVTTDFVYARFHGLRAGYAHDYSTDELRPWAEFLREAARSGRSGYAFFNNDARARAPKNALELTDLLGEESTPALPLSA